MLRRYPDPQIYGVRRRLYIRGVGVVVVVVVCVCVAVCVVPREVRDGGGEEWELPWSNKISEKIGKPRKNRIFRKTKRKNIFFEIVFFGNIKKIEIKSKKEFIKQREKNREKMIFFKKKQSKKKKRKIEKIEISRNNLPHRRHKNYFSTIYTVSQRKKTEEAEEIEKSRKGRGKIKEEKQSGKKPGPSCFPWNPKLASLAGTPCHSWDRLQLLEPLQILGLPYPEPPAISGTTCP